MNNYIFLLTLFVASVWCKESCENQHFDFALTSGYIWKNDKHFKQVYGSGIPDIITADACYYPCRYGGLGIKTSYWHASGKTTFLKCKTTLQEVPLIFYLRGKVGCHLQAYASLGGGAIFVNEKSYLGKVKNTVGIGEAEIGLNYSACNRFYITTAFRYLFPKTTVNKERHDIGGYGLRAGIGFSF
jgi:hypothetical protein